MNTTYKNVQFCESNQHGSRQGRSDGKHPHTLLLTSWLARTQFYVVLLFLQRQDLKQQKKEKRLAARQQALRDREDGKFDVWHDE